MIFGFLAPVNSPPPKRQRTEQQARQEVKQQTSNRGIIINANGKPIVRDAVVLLQYKNPWLL